MYMVLDNNTRQLIQLLKERFEIIGESPLLYDAIEKARKVAGTDITVLINGETGTGKEVFASIIHQLSNRKKAPFVSVNCAAIPETLLEAELFGHEKGAFTNAIEQRVGFFESANHGTIFLDEIGEMPISIQSKLLRILENGSYSRLGSSNINKVDVRVVAATNKDLEIEAEKGNFRRDLLYRLNNIRIELPSLRDRIEDIELLTEHFVERICDKLKIPFQEIDTDVIELLQQFPWTGNIRELRNVIETTVLLERSGHLTMKHLLLHLPPTLKGYAENPHSSMAIVRVNAPLVAPVSPDLSLIYQTLLKLTNDVNEMKMALKTLIKFMTSLQDSSKNNFIEDEEVLRASKVDDFEKHPEEYSLEDMEKNMIKATLHRFSGNRRLVANHLGISERTLYRKLQLYDIT